MFTSMWAPIKRLFERKKRQAHVTFVYFFKIVHDYITFYGQDGMDKEVFVKYRLSKVRAKQKYEIETDFALKYLRREGLDRSEQLEKEYLMHSIAQQASPLQESIYRERAFVSIEKEDFWSAVCDFRRVLALNPNLLRVHFEMAGLYLTMGKLDKAFEANRQCQENFSLPTSAGVDLPGIMAQAKAIDNAWRRNHPSRSRGLSTDLEHQQEETASESPSDKGGDPGLIYRHQLCSGSTAFLNGQYGQAQEHFQRALRLLTDQAVEVEAEEVLVLKYICGKSCLASGNYHNILDAVERFQGVLKDSDSFLAAFYGLGSAYVRLKRFEEALVPVRAGLDKVKGKAKKEDFFLWPQTDQVIQETQPAVLKRLLKELYKECLCPPQPDAVCRLHFDAEELRRNIYMSDPDYRGHVRLLCFANCCLELHATCWKMFKARLEGKVKDKDVVDTRCPTPDCWGVIRAVYIHKVDSDRPVKILSQRTWQDKVADPAPRVKVRSDNPEKLRKKMERKKVKRQKKEEAKLAKTEVEESPAVVKKDVEVEPQPVLIESEKLVELRKDEMEVLLEGKQKSSKVKKKKDKSGKQVLQVDFQYAGDDGKELFGAHSLDEDGNAVSQPSRMTLGGGGLLPFPGTGPLPIGNGLLPLPSFPLFKDQAAEDLYLFFQDLLHSSGPVELEGPEISEALADISLDDQHKIFWYGGLANFLRSRGSFFVLEDRVVCNVEDSSRARELLGRKTAAVAGATVPASKPFSWEQRAKEMDLQRLAAEEEMSSAGQNGQVKPPLNPAAAVRAVSAIGFPHLSEAVEVNPVDDNAGGFIADAHPKTQRLLENSLVSSAGGSGLNPAATEFNPGRSLMDEPKSSSVWASQGQNLSADSGHAKERGDQEFTLVSRKKSQELKNSTSLSGLSDFSKHSDKLQKRMETPSLSDSWRTDALAPRGLSPSPSGSAPHNSQSPAPNQLSRRSSDASVSSEDLQRSASPASSSHSVGSGSTQSSAPKPLRAPRVALPTRGKKTLRPGSRLGRVAVLGQRPPSSNGSTGSGPNGEEEERESQTSDRDSEGSDLQAAPPNTSGTVPPLGGVLPPLSSGLGQSRSKPARLGYAASADDAHTSGYSQDTAFLPFSEMSRGSLLPNSPVIGREKTLGPGSKFGVNKQDPLGLSSIWGTDSGLDGSYSDSDRRLLDLSHEDKSLLNDDGGVRTMNPASDGGSYVDKMRSSFMPFGSPFHRHSSLSSSSESSSSQMNESSSLNKKFPYVGSLVGERTYRGNDGPLPKSDSSDFVYQSGSNFGINGPDRSVNAVGGSAISGVAGEKESESLYGLQNQMSTNTFPAVGDFEPGILLPKDLLSTSSPSRQPSLGDLHRSVIPSEDIDGLGIGGQFRNREYCPMSLGSVPSAPLSEGGQGPAEIFPSQGSLSLQHLLPPSSSSSLSSPSSSQAKFSSAQSTDFHSNPSHRFTGVTVATDSSSPMLSGSAERDSLPPLSFPVVMQREQSSQTSAPARASVAVNTALTMEILERIQTNTQKLTARLRDTETTNKQLKLELEESRQLCALQEASMQELVTQRQDLSSRAHQVQEEKGRLTGLLRQSEEEKEELRSQLKEAMAALSERGDMAGLAGQLDKEVTRAQLAEAQTLATRCQLSTLRMDWNIREAARNLKQLQSIISHLKSQGKTPTAEMVNKMAEFRDYISCCQLKKADIQTSYTSQKEELRSGKRMEELQPIAFSPPPMPSPPGTIEADSEASSETDDDESVADDDNESQTIKTSAPTSDIASSQHAGQIRRLLGGATLTPISVASSGSGSRPSSQGSEASADRASVPAHGLRTSVGDRPTVRGGGLSNPLLPLSTAHAPLKLPRRGGLLGAPTRPTVGVARGMQRQQPTFERLVLCVQQRFVHYTKQDIGKVVDELRRSSGGSLSQIEFSDLVNKVSEMILEKEANNTVAAAKVNGGQPESLGIEDSMVTVGPMTSSSDNLCTICHEEIVHDRRVLSCGHSFHNQCIMSWLEVQRSCPNCRGHTLLPEDFPSLR
ncbi:uncharacterized protein LOC101848395 [Aplysia californica]|uniref:Uncharacterized protein LOC101848395 n=1 Tax=Aplysia californica TaxID=6500 RepID=A0ABM1ACY6_APLCA|nr:uncharacterized protein LOC101848395 [Aplysia californica]